MMPMASVRASSLLSSPLLPPLSRSRPSSLPPPFPSLFYRPFPPPSLLPARSRLSSAPPPSSFRRSSRFSRRPDRLLCRAAEYQFPDPIPEFALAETTRFRTHMLERLTKKKEYFGDSVGEVVDVCTEIFSKFLHTEYGGPGTLLVIPFIDMADTLREKGLPGAPQAARAAVVWAQKHVDKDWKEWPVGRDLNSDSG
ncbi:protein PLASTID REDOX INSENSITIVE 2, chloroplastic-like [Zingiber officinale]|uniref:protein PLASTID REDOX INSENSITIVE 2, chloroplastic-like n=1 Tax=Zingiber officinale TaxID=94328 RepID=UPI001C4B08D5|nr:protein PLASTID REDOX INSENSITIVE 2, chloroplastic-like [Zingiber officinale]